MAAFSFARVEVADAYAAIALVIGLFFLIATPPFGTADETAHFERAYEVSIGAFTGADGVTPGMQKTMDDAFGKVDAGGEFTQSDFERLSRIELQAGETTPWPDPMRRVVRLHSPICYAHLAPIVAAGVALSFPPLAIFYLGRLAALVVGVFLVRAAIATAPASFRPPLVFIALLPTTVVFFSAFNIDSLLIGLGLYYFALVAKFAGEPSQKLTRGDVIRLAAIAFMLGQFKTGYLLLPTLAILIPTSKFGSLKARALSLALIILPGVAMSLGWAMVVKTEMLGDIVYSIANSDHVEPSAQLAHILADPFAYAMTVLRTFMQSDAASLAWFSFLALGGWTTIILSPTVYSILTLGFLLVWLSGDKAPPALSSRPAILVQLSIALATIVAILTLVYLQWNDVDSPAIAGFQGRYLTPFAPLILAAAPVRLSLVAEGARRWTLAFGVPAIGLAAMASAIIGRYY